MSPPPLAASTIAMMSNANTTNPSSPYMATLLFTERIAGRLMDDKAGNIRVDSAPECDIVSHNKIRHG
jgi:hypothetical protein